MDENVLKAAEARRLAWRCRRGLLELDIVLQRFVASEFKTLSLPELTALDALLALPDNDFWDLLLNKSIAKPYNKQALNPDLNAILNEATISLIKKIQAMHQER